MPSGAFHDAQFVVPVCPTGMIFVPCRKGVSHNPAEWSEPGSARERHARARRCAGGARGWLRHATSSGYGRTPPDPAWPDGAVLAVNFVLNYEEGAERNILYGDAESESYLGENPSEPRIGARNLNMESVYEYGSRAGFWRIWRLFTARRMPLTVYGVTQALAANPEAVAAMREAGWEIASHGLRWIDHKDMPEDEERRHIAQAIALHEAVCGERPLGWYTGRGSVNTLRLVSEAGGFLYLSDNYADDLPYWTRIGGCDELIIPYTLDCNDMRFAIPAGFPSGGAFFEYLRDAFDLLYAEGEGGPAAHDVGRPALPALRPPRTRGGARALPRPRRRASACVGDAARGDRAALAGALPMSASVAADRAPARVLARIPAAFFGIVLGLAGLGNTWRAAHRVWGLPAGIGEGLMLAAAVVWAVLVVLTAAKWIAAWEAARTELQHPVQCCFVGLIGVATMLVAGAALPYARGPAWVLFLAGALFTLGFALWRTGLLWHGERDAGATTAVLYLPAVAGSFVVATTASAFGYPDWGQLAFGAGFFSWLAIESVLLHRLYTAPGLPVALRPTLGIQLAPPVVGAVAYLATTAGTPDMLVRAMFGYGLLQALLLLRLLPWIGQQAFAPSVLGLQLRCDGAGDDADPDGGARRDGRDRDARLAGVRAGEPRDPDARARHAGPRGPGAVAAALTPETF